MTCFALAQRIVLIVKVLRVAGRGAESGRMRIILVALGACHAACPSGELLRMACRTFSKIVLSLFQDRSVEIGRRRIKPAGIMDLERAGRRRRQILHTLEITAGIQQ